jgi:SPP1 gp7 family putative phage head morphogenesis protein
VPEIESELEFAVRDFRRRLLRQERTAASEMVRAYGTIWRDVNRRINDLTREYYQAVQTGQATNTSWLYQFERLQTLRAQVEAQLAEYARYAATTIQAQQWEALQAGTEHGYELMAAASSRTAAAQGVDTVFNRLPANAIDYAVGFQQDGSPLVDVLNRYGQDAAKGMGNALVQGLALGQNPSVIARFARKQFGMALWEALRLARTETLRAYRTASLETYRANSDVVAGWVWMSARNERTCAMCWAMDGTFHKLDESLDDHPNGRCTQLPKIKGMELPLRGTGVEAFEKLAPEQQLKILGPSKFAAYKAGDLKLKQLIGVKRSEKWGRMFYERSLSDVLGPEDAKRYYSAPGSFVMQRVAEPKGPYQVVAKYEKQIVSQHFESAYAVNQQGQVILFKKGQTYSVDFTDDEIKKLENTILTHNHPRGWKYPDDDPRRQGNSFSDDDIRMACKAKLAEIRAVTPMWRHRMKPPATGWDLYFWENTVKPEFDKADIEVTKWFEDKIARGKISYEKASALHYHKVWKRVAKSTGLIYNRVRW